MQVQVRVGTNRQDALRIRRVDRVEDELQRVRAEDHADVAAEVGPAGVLEPDVGHVRARGEERRAPRDDELVVLGGDDGVAGRRVGRIPPWWSQLRKVEPAIWSTQGRRAAGRPGEGRSRPKPGDGGEPVQRRPAGSTGRGRPGR